MGGKKGPEKNRKYEKDRRDRFNDQFVELHKLLPDFISSSAKATKAEIISKTIQYLKDSHSQTRKLEIEFENEKIKVNELQKKVNGVLQIVKELIKLLHKSNIRFPSSLPVDDFKTFQDVLAKSKKELTLVSDDGNNANDVDSDDAVLSTDSESEKRNDSSKVPTDTTKQMNQSSESVSTVNNLGSSSSIQINKSGTDTNSNEPKVLKLNSEAFILPSGNLFTVNSPQNNILNCYNNAPPLLLNRQLAVPTLILMQNNFVPVNMVQHIAVSQRTQKLILPKQTINTTKTTFINKKPIPSVRLYKATSIANNGARKAVTPRRRRTRRSKGILVKYPKRKPPTKNKKRELRSKKSAKFTKVVSNKSENTNAGDTFDPADGEPSFPGNSNGINKTYPCADNMLHIPEIRTTGQFIDFLENTASRCMDSTTNNNSSECNRNSELLKGEKSQINNFVTNSFEHSFPNTSLSCALIESHEKRNSNKVIAEGSDQHANQKTISYDQPQTTSDPLLKYVPSAEKNFTPINSGSASENNAALEKPKSSEKEIATLRSTSKDLNLSLIDDKKHYESSFDEFSNDLFTSLQVPPSGHNADSISPTAAFLQTFPLVSSGTNVDLLPEHEDDNVTTTTSTSVLQMGNLESPSNMLFSSKSTNREASKVGSIADVSTNFVSYGTTSLDLEITRKEKKSACKEVTQPSLGFNDIENLNSQLKTCTKDVSQNMSFYPTSTSTSTFSSYNIFTKYNDFPPPVTCSYYSLCSQPYTTSKTTDSVGDFTSWMSSVCTPEESNKDKTKKDKCVHTFKSIQDIESYSGDMTSERPKSKKPKLNNTRPLVNWMTTPDLRSASDISQSTDAYTLSKDDSTNLNSYLGCNSSNNTNFNAYSGTDYFLENQNYSESQLANCKLSYSSANSCNHTWASCKTTLPLPRETSNVIIPSTLPTLVGDLALGNTSTFNNYDLTSAKKFESEKKKPCRNYCKSVTTPNSSSFLSVTQLVDDKSLEKTTKKHTLDIPSCSFDEEQEKGTYALNHRNSDGTEYASKKNYSNICKDTKSQPHMKCKKDSMRYQALRCSSKENKKDSRNYSMQNCQIQNKEVNPLSSKNSNYSAESLISSTNQNVCSTTGYFPYENSTNYGSCSTNDYSKKRTDETESLANVGYYTNSNYVYHNNFQSFNNYGFSNQCYNNYSSQIQTSGFQKKKDESYNAKSDAAEWSLSSYNAIVQSDFSNNQKVDPKCKQSFSNKYSYTQKNCINSDMYNKYYQVSPAPSTLTQSKSNCAFNSTCSFNQTEGQSYMETNYLAPNYEMKSTRNSNGMNTNNVHSATTLTNFNLRTIFPEINDKHCSTSQVNAASNEKNDPKYGKNNVDETNFNYFLQPTVENNTDHFYGSSTFPIHNFTDFTSRKALK